MLKKKRNLILNFCQVNYIYYLENLCMTSDLRFTRCKHIVVKKPQMPTQVTL